MDEHATKLQQNVIDTDKHGSVAARVGMLVGRVSTELTRECERQGAWGVMGKGTGGKLVQGGQVMTRNQIIGECSGRQVGLKATGNFTGRLVGAMSRKDTVDAI